MGPIRVDTFYSVFGPMLKWFESVRCLLDNFGASNTSRRNGFVSVWFKMTEARIECFFVALLDI